MSAHVSSLMMDAKILLPLFRKKKRFSRYRKKLENCENFQLRTNTEMSRCENWTPSRTSDEEKESFCKILFSELSRSSVCWWNGNKKKFETGSCNVIIRKLEKRHCQLLWEIYGNYQKSKVHCWKLMKKVKEIYLRRDENLLTCDVAKFARFSEFFFF